MISNICVIGLNNSYTKFIAKKLSDKLEMFHADIMDLLSFDLINLAEAENVVGKEYILRQEQNKIKTVSGYENTVITVNYETLNNETNYKFLHEGALIVFLGFSDSVLNKLNNNEKFKCIIDDNLKQPREKILKEKCDIIVSVNSLNDLSVLNKIIKQIEEYYEHR